MPYDLEGQQARLNALWQRLVHTLGVHSVNVLLDRAIWQAAQQYPALASIRHDDDGLSLGALAGRPVEDADAAFNLLHDEMLLVLARLLGQDMARRLLDELEAEKRSSDGPDGVATATPLTSSTAPQSLGPRWS